MFSFFKKTAMQDSRSTSEKESNNEVNALKNKLKDMEAKVAQLQGIQSAMPDPYYVRDMDYNIIIWPDVIAKLTGYSGSEARKMKCYDIFRAAVCPPQGQCPTQHCIMSKQFLSDVAVHV
jgi:PAS domain-containing protein